MTTDSICIVTPPHYFSETFIRAHEQLLQGKKVILSGTFPDYTFEGRKIQYFYNRHKTWRRFLKALPYWYYEKYKKTFEPESETVFGYLSEFLQTHHVRVILAEYGVTGADIAPVAKALNIPLIVHFHGHDAYHLKYLRDYDARFKEMFAYASHLISVSEDMSEQLDRLGAPKAKIVYNPYGPREYFHDIKPEYAGTFLAVGRFAETKAPHLTISAFKILCNEAPHARLVMVGDGPLREACTSLAEGLKIRDRVEFPGALDHQETRKLLTNACCFVQHSITTSEGVKEGTPVAILEAGAAGLPVIATRHAGIKEAVIHGKTGFLVDEKDVCGMGAHMRTLFFDRELCRQLGKNARLHIRQNFPLSRHIKCLDDLVGRHLEKR